MIVIKQAVRILLKHRRYFSINLLGLVLSLSCSMILARYIHQELTVDHCIKDLDRVYLVVNDYQNGSPKFGATQERSSEERCLNTTDVAIEAHTSFIMRSNSEIVVNEVRRHAHIIITDTLFLQLLSYSVKMGSPVFQRPTDAIITERFAKKLFGKEDPLGKTFTYELSDKILTVTGILKEPATRRSINFDVLLSHELLDRNATWSYLEDILLKLHSGVNYRKWNSKHGEFVPLWFDIQSRFQLFPLEKFYTDNTLHVLEPMMGIIQKGKAKNILLLTLVMIMLLVIGFFNYTNIYTVLMLSRAREFGVKKVYGASGKYVFGQIWMENLLLIMFALLLVWSVIELTGGWMETLFSIPLHSSLLFDTGLSLFVILVFPILVSLHPTMKYNYAPPVVSLRSVNMAGKSVVSRVVFLLLQYVATFFIVVVSFFFMKQLRYMLDTDLGYRTENIVRVPLISNIMVMNDDKYEFARSLAKEFGRKMDESLLVERWSQGKFLHMLTPHEAVKSEYTDFQQVFFDYLSRDHMDVFGFQLLEGRLWDSEWDVMGQHKVIINETAKKLFEIKDITQERLQFESNFWSNSTDDEGKNPSYEIVGVIKDFKTNHLSKANAPIVIVYDGEPYVGDPFVVAVNPNQKAAAIEFLRDTYTELMGDNNFEYTWLEDEIEALYNEDKRVTTIYMTFAFVAILISCLGLYGLSLYDIRQRYREIALRKVNGASTKDIVTLFRRKYIRILVVSFLLSVPFSYFVIHKYLEGFAHKAPVSWWLFAVAALLVAAISYLTLHIQIRKAVKINPAVALKGE